MTNHIISYYIILYIIKVRLRRHNCAKWLHQKLRQVTSLNCRNFNKILDFKNRYICRNFNKILDFKNRYIHIFWINMTNQVMKESSISFTTIIVVSI